jgi:RNA polymerase sigma-70 factor (ECF subfamily)
MLLACGNPEEAEDLAQEAMVRAYERWDRVQKSDHPAGYVFMIAFNLNRKRLRRAAMAFRKLRGGAIAAESARDCSEEALSRVEALRILSALPARLKEAVVLVELLGMSAEEAGEVIGIRAVSVRGRIHKARELVRARFGQRDG